MADHELKTWPDHWREIAAGRKTFELRKDDRGFAVGDRLALLEYDPTTERYSGNRCTCTVTHLLRGGQFGLAGDHVCMSIAYPVLRCTAVEDDEGDCAFGARCTLDADHDGGHYY